MSPPYWLFLFLESILPILKEKWILVVKNKIANVSDYSPHELQTFEYDFGDDNKLELAFESLNLEGISQNKSFPNMRKHFSLSS